MAASPGYSGRSEFASVIRWMDAETAAIVAKLLADGSPHRFGSSFLEMLRDAYVAAHLAGQSVNGADSQTMARARAQQAVVLGRIVTNPVSGNATIVHSQGFFLEGFVRDLAARDKRYFDEDGALRVDQVTRRATQYQAGVRSAQAYGVMDSASHAARWKWELGGAEEHCDDCPFLATLEPVPASEWFALPGEGLTQCVVGCKCHMVDVESGQTTAGYGETSL